MNETRLPHEKHIHLPNAAVMARLLEHRGDRSLSMYIPTTESDEAITKNRIRFKNAVSEASDALSSMGASKTEIDELLAPLDGWEDDDQRWAHQGRGLAIFLHDGEVESFRLPTSVEPRVLVGDRFHLLPLLQLHHASAPHYVLCLEQNGPTLYASSAFTMDPLVVDFPSLEDALGYDTTERHTQGHSTTNDGGRWIIHGHGSGSDEEHKREIRKYCRIIDERVRAYLPNDRTPLVVVAVDYVGVIYVEASDHPNIVGRVEGNPGSFDRQELHRRAYAVAEDTLRAPEKRDLDDLRQALHSSETAAKEIEKVLAAATDGRVEVLFLEPSDRLIGEWDETARELKMEGAGHRSDHRLMDRAAREVLDKGGRLRFVDGDALPGDEPLAALLRY